MNTFFKNKYIYYGGHLVSQTIEQLDSWGLLLCFHVVDFILTVVRMVKLVVVGLAFHLLGTMNVRIRFIEGTHRLGLPTES